MKRYLRPQLHAARTGRDLVLLDLRTGRYSLLAGAGETVEVYPCGRRLSVQDASLGALLIQDGLCVPQALFAPTPLLPVSPIRSALRVKVRPSPKERLCFIAAWGEMLAHYYGRDLPALLKRAQAWPVSPEMTNEGQERLVERTAEAFHQLSPWAPFQGECVFRCFMLLRALKSQGARNVRWVFGVRTWPFYAHCWLQLGDLALTDHAEPLTSFAPIFAL